MQLDMMVLPEVQVCTRQFQQRSMTTKPDRGGSQGNLGKRPVGITRPLLTLSSPPDDDTIKPMQGSPLSRIVTMQGS